jgi:hypothetical protein
MLTFKQFINESFDLLLESEVSFSDNFLKILNKIKHPLAKKIIELHKIDLPVVNNFFEINPDDNSKIFFIPDRKAKELLQSDKKHVRFIGGNGGWLRHSENNQNIFDQLGYKSEGTAYRPNSSEIGEVQNEYKSNKTGKVYYYVKFNNGSGVYNLEKLEEVKDISKKLFGLAKQELNIGRAMRALLTSAKIEFTNKELEDFVNEYKSTLDLYGGIFSNFELVSGSEIAYWYKVENYSKKTGTLGSSCMREVNEEFFDIYTMNPEVCSLLILKEKNDSSKIIGRALLWTTVEGKKFLDRIYTINDSDVNLFKEYAKNNGWYSKVSNNSSNNNYTDAPDGSKIYINLTIDIQHSGYDYYPYLDTIKYFSPTKKTLSTYNSSGAYLLEDTDGEYSYCDTCNSEGTVECSECGGSGTNTCYRCNGDGYDDCSTCEGDGEIEDSEGMEIECPDCDGNGREECDWCSGEGEEQCSECNGEGTIECYDCS